MTPRSRQLSQFSIQQPLKKFSVAVVLLHALCAAPVVAKCQTTNAASTASTESTPPATQAMQPVSTTIVVQGHVADDYLANSLEVGSLDGLPLLSAPISATVVKRDLMQDQFSRVLSDVLKNDASIGEDYAPVGYYGDFEIRGFVIDLATGLQIDGLPIAGEQDVPLENKEQVEFLKGVAGVESGVTTAGGLIDYVTKRPALVKTLDLATDHRGTAFLAIDLGRFFGARAQFGLRSNIAGEEIKSYVQHADGWRAMGSDAADWKISDRAALRTDFEYQHKVERSEAGYQLLGGTVVPRLNSVFPSVMLGFQPYAKPNTFDAFNSGSRLDLDVTPDWHTYMAASYSHSVIDDNVIYPYGAALDSSGNSLCPNSPYYFFCPDGSYEIYDYRSPGELRIDTEGEVITTGKLKTGAVTHDLVAGGSLFYRSVDLSPTIVYTQLGAENIFQSVIPYPIETPVQHAGPAVLADFNHQASGIFQDRLVLPGRIRMTAGGRYVSVSDFNYSGKKGMWLPQYYSTWSPVANMTLYGSYSVMLSLGPQAPFWVDNSSVYLAPYLTRQAEIGAKFEPGQRVLFSAALFHMRAPFFYPRLIQDPDDFCMSDVTPGSQCFESDGHETHDGIELGAQGKVASWLQLSATAAGISAQSDDSLTPSFNGKQVINVPRVRVAAFADLRMPRVPGLGVADLHLIGGWGYSSSKEATRDDAVSVSGYNLFNLGARYTPEGEQGRVSLRIYADNILNKRYWKDTGASYGDTFIHLGAPATVRLSGQYRF